MYLNHIPIRKCEFQLLDESGVIPHIRHGWYRVFFVGNRLIPLYTHQRSLNHHQLIYIYYINYIYIYIMYTYMYRYIYICVYNICIYIYLVFDGSMQYKPILYTYII